ncbi:MAG TPA: beta-L-arabinofuranosidase domain-containing protein, partial [Opitutaceae bacterium]|nr:beta-L-arabinofuranosidase domain-containing protein [Opitutaceae bacterium]
PAVVRRVATPPTDRRNDHYVGNRAPLAPTPLVPLPLRAIEPRGWLRQELELQADGFHGHLAEISRFLKKRNNAWLDPHGRGDHGWEEVPYWLRGFAHNAYLLGRSDQIREAQTWIEGALASQRADGWFGPRQPKPTVKSTSGAYDLWPNMIMLAALETYYDDSGDERVIDLMRRYFRWELAVPEDEFLPPYWQQQRAADNLWSVYWLYNRTGEPWLLDLARKIHRHTADWDHGIASAHNVNIAEGFDSPAIYWEQSHAGWQLAAADRNWQTVRAEYGQVPGGMFGADEQYRPGYTDPRQAIETCGIVEEMLSDEQMLQIDGDPQWADREENVAFNTFPAAVMADFSGLRYLTAPNQPQSDAASKAPGIRNGGAMFLMSPSRYRCCQHNFGQGWPDFASSLWFATGDDGLAAVFYSESRVNAKVGPGGSPVSIRETTHYPFDEHIRLQISVPGPVRFPLYLRVPAWCTTPALSVNGTALPVAAGGGGFLVVDRTWRENDAIELTLPMRLSLRRWTANHDSVSLDRGPLTFSLLIKERYQRDGGTDRWPSWEIWPASPWNYGLVLQPGPADASFKLVERPWPADDRPFTQAGAPLVIEATGRRIPEWQLDAQGLVGVLQASPALTREPAEHITLIPMGAARLRISAFPAASNEPGAHRWTTAGAGKGTP